MVPLIGVLLAPLKPKGFPAQVPQPDGSGDQTPNPEVVVLEVLEGGGLRINQQPVTWDSLGSRLNEIFKQRAAKVAFIRAEAPIEFSKVVRAIDLLHAAGIGSAGLLTPGLEQRR